MVPPKATEADNLSAFESPFIDCVLHAMGSSKEFMDEYQSILRPEMFSDEIRMKLAEYIQRFYAAHRGVPGETYSAYVREQCTKERSSDAQTKLRVDKARQIIRMNNVNIQYVREQLNDFAEFGRLKATRYLLDAAIDNKNLEEAKKVVADAQGSLDGNTNIDLNKHYLTFSELQALEISEPVKILEPWLRAGDTTIVYSESGVGKTHLGLVLSYIVTRNNYQSKACHFADWRVMNPCGVLYIDGEMGQADMKQITSTLKYLGAPIAGMEPVILCAPEYQISTGTVFDLAKPGYQQQVIKFFKDHPNYRVLIMDSLTTLFMLDDENSNAEYTKKVQTFLQALRGLGVAQILHHHAGKAGTQRGASAQTTIASNIIHLTNHPNKTRGQAWFKIDFEDKQRAGGAAFQTTSVKFTGTDDRLEWVATDNNDDREDSILIAIIEGQKQRNIAEGFKISQPWVSNYKKKAVGLGLINQAGKATPAGLQFVQEKRGY